MRRVLPTEADTLKAICDWLDGKRVLYIRVNPIRAIARKEIGGKWLYGFARTRRSQIGVADLIVMPKDKPDIAVEVKSPSGEQSRTQVEWQNRCLHSGRQYSVCRSIDDFVRMMEPVR
jgi:hypothetical protein